MGELKLAEIKAFRALRYTEAAGDISTLVCPPYDVISEKERLALLAHNPRNAVRLELPKQQDEKGENPDNSTRETSQDPYALAGETLHAWISDGTLRQDTDPGLYIYEEEFDAFGERRKVKGFFCLVKLEEFSKGIILPHEETLSKAKEDRFRLMKATGCNFSGVYSLYMDENGATSGKLDALSSGRPRYEFSIGPITHRLWLVNDREGIESICKDFAPRKLYIADGHHRYETALNYRNWKRSEKNDCEGDNYVMMMLVNMKEKGLTVFPTHRLVHGLSDFSASSLLKKCGENFSLQKREDIDTAGSVLQKLGKEGKQAFALYTGGPEWFLLVLKEKSAAAEALRGKSEAYRGLDVSVLHSLILEKFLGINRENMKNQKNLSYTRSAEEAVDSVRRGESQCAFLLNPTRVEQICDVAAAGEKMPQKSTYFYPKPLTGLVFNRLSTSC